MLGVGNQAPEPGGQEFWGTSFLKGDVSVPGKEGLPGNSCLPSATHSKVDTWGQCLCGGVHGVAASSASINELC